MRIVISAGLDGKAKTLYNVKSDHQLVSDRKLEDLIWNVLVNWDKLVEIFCPDVIKWYHQLGGTRGENHVTRPSWQNSFPRLLNWNQPNRHCVFIHSLVHKIQSDCVIKSCDKIITYLMAAHSYRETAINLKWFLANIPSINLSHKSFGCTW